MTTGPAAPFATAEAAWFWTLDRVKADQPCTCAATVLEILDLLYRHHRIDLVHARTLRMWGDRGRAPHPHVLSERRYWTLWTEAMGRLEQHLRVRGIVA